MGIGFFKKRLKKIIVSSFLSYSKKRKRKIIFVLSTGRSGSESITRIFNQNPKFLAFHEAIPELIPLSNVLAEEPWKKEEVYESLKKIFRNRQWEAKKDQIIIHSDHRLWNLVGFLSEYFHNSDFVHLVREPLPSIKSFLSRNWFSQDEFLIPGRSKWAKYRLKGNKIGEISNDKWENMSQLSKITWYWYFVNRSIQEQIIKIPSRSCIMKLNEIDERMNGTIKRKYNLKGDFYFKNVISNQKKSYPNFENEEDLDNIILEELFQYELTKIKLFSEF